MTHEAELFKSSNDLDYQNLNMKDFNTFPVLSGIYNFSAGRHKFDLICIRNDDSSVVSYFWKGHHDKTGLNLWSEITTNDGIFIDVGAHTGLYTIIGLLSNPKTFNINRAKLYKFRKNEI